MASAAMAMTLPIVEVVIRDGAPIFRVQHGARSFEHHDRWQAEVVAHSWAAQLREPPTVVDGDGGRFGEGGL